MCRRLESQQHDQDVSMTDDRDPLAVRPAADQGTGVGGAGLGHAGDADLCKGPGRLILSADVTPDSLS